MSLEHRILGFIEAREREFERYKAFHMPDEPVPTLCTLAEICIRCGSPLLWTLSLLRHKADMGQLLVDGDSGPRSGKRMPHVDASCVTVRPGCAFEARLAELRSIEGNISIPSEKSDG